MRGVKRGLVGFNWLLGLGENRFVAIAGGLVRRPVLTVTLFIILLFAAGLLLRMVPTGFLPLEDESVFFVNVQLPDGAKLSRTKRVMADLEADLLKHPATKSVVSLGGNSFLVGANQSNTGTIVVVLRDWDSRSEDISEVIGAASGSLFSNPDSIAFPFRPPAIQGIGQAGGFDLRIQDREALGIRALETATDDIIKGASADPLLSNVFTGFRAQVPQARLEIDRQRAKQMGVSLDTIFATLRGSLGSAYVNDFNLFGRAYQVQTQAEAPFRDELSDIARLQVRNANGDMLPLGSLVRTVETVGPSVISRYNLFPAATISGSPAPGQSTGTATARIETLSRSVLPAGIGMEWSGATFQEQRAGNQAPIAFGLALLVVFLLLAAQYESWTAPISILLTVPIGILGALAALAVRSLEVNVYTQFGFVLLIALVAKNSILIVEFARQLRSDGHEIANASLEAARLRFRPLLMTATSFIFGTLPLVVASGAGAASRQSLGTAVFGGMVIATAIGLFFVPAFETFIARFERPKTLEVVE